MRPSSAASGSCPSRTGSGGAGCSSCSRPPRRPRGRRSSCGAARRRTTAASACRAAVAVLAAVPSERDVVVGGTAAEVALIGRRARLDELRLVAHVAATAEELDGVRDDLDCLALGAVLGLPLAPLEPAVD